MTFPIKLIARNNKYLVDYPSFQCGGEWALVDKDVTRAKFKEKLNHGLHQCMDNGDIVIETVSDSQIRFKWFMPKGTVVVASAILNKR